MASAASSSTPLLECLRASRGVLRLAGADTERFLQGLVTNDVSLVREGRPQYTAVLNSSGRFLHDLFLHRLAGEEHTLLCDTSRDSLPEVVRVLRRYKLRAQVDIADVSTEYSVWTSPAGSAGSDASLRSEARHWPLDPRLPALGRRAVVHQSKAEEEPAEGQGSAEGHLQRRLELGVAEGDVEIPSGKAIPLEYNLDALHGVSFTKGCYVGQELVARTHYQGMIRKRLVPITASAGPLEVGQEIVLGDSSKPVGRVAVGSGTSGLAQLRLSALGREAAQQQGSLRLADSQVEVTAKVPGWWPEAWRTG